MANDVTIEKILIAVEANTAKVEARLAKLETQLDSTFRDREVDVDVDADLPPRSVVGRMIDAVFGGHRREVKVRTDKSQASMKKLTTATRQFTKSIVQANIISKIFSGTIGLLSSGAMLGGLAFLIGQATVAVVALGAALVGILGTLKQVSALFAALPLLIGSAIQAFAGFAAIASGVGAAISAGNAQNIGGGGGGGLSEEQKARAVEDAERRVVMAERNLAQAKENSAFYEKELAKAQEYLTEAREDAAEAVDDLRISVERLTLSEKQANANIDDARRRLLATEADPNATERDRRDALLALEDAEVSLKEIQDARQDTQKELNERIEAGIDGSPEVLAALENQAYLQKAVADSAFFLVDAETELKRAQEDLAKVAAGDFGGGGGTAFAEAMQQLTPATQGFVTAVVNDLLPALRDIKKEMQEIFFAGGGKDVLDALIAMLPEIETVGIATAEAFSSIGTSLAEYLGGPQFRDDFEFLGTTGAGYIETFGEAFVNFLAGLTNFAVASEPFVTWLVNGFLKLSESFRGWAESGRADGSILKFLEDSMPILETWQDIFSNIGGIFAGIFRAAAPFGKDLLYAFEELTARADDWANSDEGQKRMREWFDSMKPPLRALGDLIGAASEFIAQFSEENAGNFVAFATETLPLVGEKFAEILQFLMDAGSSQGFRDLIDGLFALGEIIVSRLASAGPVFRFIADGLSAIANLPLGDQLLELAVLAGLFMALATPILLFVSAMMSAAALFSPVTAIVLVVAALAAAAYLIWRNWDTIGPLLTKIFEQIWAVIGPIVQLLWESIQRFGEVVVEIFTNVIQFFQNVFAGNWRAAFDNLVAIVLAVPQLVIGGVGDLGQKLWDVMKTGFAVLKYAVKAILDEIVEFFVSLPGRVKEWVLELLVEIATIVDEILSLPEKILGIATSVFEAMKSVGKNLIDGIVSGIKANAQKVADAIASLPGASIIGGAVSFVQDAITNSANGALVAAQPGGEIHRVGEGNEMEAIIPLSRLEGIITGKYDSLLNSGTTDNSTTNNKNTTVNIYEASQMSPRDLTWELERMGA